jgi:DNA-binding transcriptional LysR family regulator
MIRTEALRVFVTVAECGNIRDAAAQLFRTQSAVSMTLKQLEQELGASLFEADRKNSLSDLGQFVADIAKLLLRDHDTAIDQIRHYATGKSGRLRIASVPSVAALLIPEILAAFVKERPTAEIDLVDTHSADVRRLVAIGQADIGIASVAQGDSGLFYVPVFEDNMKLVCQATSPLAHHPGPLEWRHLKDAALILNETTRGIQAVEFRALADQTSLTVRNVISLLAIVRAGVGVTLLPGLATVGLTSDLVARPLADQGCRRQVCLLRREGRVQSPIAIAFQQHFISTLGPMTERFGILWAYND